MPASDPSGAKYILETERMVLRPFRAGDAAHLTGVFNDAYARRFYPEMSSVSGAERWIARNIERYHADGFGLWAACLKATGELVGDCGLTRQVVEATTETEVGYHLRADQRGRGLIAEAARACLDCGFAEFDCDRLVSMVHPENDASMRVAERLHARSRRFERLGDLYHLFYTDRGDWSPADREKM